MKKTILKTALISFCSAIVILIAAFGIASFCAPAAMMRFTDSLGMKTISGDYAYQEYERSKDLEYLARAFVTAAESKRDGTADERFRKLYGEEGSEAREKFTQFCNGYTVESGNANVSAFSYRSYLCGLASRVKYRLAKEKSEEVRGQVCDFALAETQEFTSGSPAVALALEALDSRDNKFCTLYVTKIKAKGYPETDVYRDIVAFLEGCNE